MKQVFRSGYGDRVRVPAVLDSRSLTKQSFHDECEINRILHRFEKTGQLPQSERAPEFLDCVNIPDFATAHRMVSQTRTQFAALPAVVRSKFDNDPVKLVAFLQDPKNAAEAVKLGLMNPPKDEVAEKAAARAERVAEAIEVAKAVKEVPDAGNAS